MSSVYHGVGVPAATPDHVVTKLQDTFLKIANDPEVRARKLKDGILPIAMPAADAKALIDSRKDLWAPIVKEFAE